MSSDQKSQEGTFDRLTSRKLETLAAFPTQSLHRLRASRLHPEGVNCVRLEAGHALSAGCVEYRGEIKCHNEIGTQPWDTDHFSRSDIKGHGSSTNA
ncbi:MAG TPA: hypothetical protein VJB59_11360 [Bdellovibrionota bacterium]|nr:hypothetical protein [Bdellovibrionota bacterium]